MEIEDSDKHDRYITKLMTVDNNKYMVVLIYWFNLYYVTLGITNNTDVFDSRKRSL